MDCEPEELQFLSLFGIYRESMKLLVSWRPLFSKIAAAFVFPLSFLFLAHIHVSYYLFSSIDSDDSALDSATPGSPAESHILSRLFSDWASLLLFKAFYLIALLVFSLLSTAAVVFTVASVYSAKDGLSFPRVLSVVPKVWRRLLVTFLAAFLFLFAYNFVSIALIVIAVLPFVDQYPSAAGAVFILLLLPYLAGLVYVSVVWHLASVVSVLEDSKGFDAMGKSKVLIKGKFWTAAAIFVKLNICFVGVEVGFRKLVSEGRGLGAGGRLGWALVMLVLLCAVVLFALVVQSVVYFVCKSYHHESIDKGNLADHLEVYLGEYVPLKSKDVQLEQFHV
ncbi:uncharacterized protein [Typha angustifolia]|uniref:uncharacterized protein n=1 Tax=Typha angustifolia TaxID=59011 RepID=UPI003C2C4F4A